MIARATPDDDLAPHAPLSLLAPALLRARQVNAHPPPARTPLPARPAYARVFARPVTLRRSPYLRPHPLPNQNQQHMGAGATAKASTLHILLGAGQTPTPCRPHECVVGLGVDRAPGCGLRFVYANARAWAFSVSVAAASSVMEVEGGLEGLISSPRDDASRRVETVLELLATADTTEKSEKPDYADLPSIGAYSLWNPSLLRDFSPILSCSTTTTSLPSHGFQVCWHSRPSTTPTFNNVCGSDLSGPGSSRARSLSLPGEYTDSRIDSLPREWRFVWNTAQKPVKISVHPFAGKSSIVFTEVRASLTFLAVIGQSPVVPYLLYCYVADSLEDVRKYQHGPLKACHLSLMLSRFRYP
ncbi:hypothetical protein B0H14DRAFT_3573334 [Mycena olivaceomarginata]|nr:hypothetical protein B0H14DRAFT_3573334 [Mycena olivaceomarginata]